jgi:hypothetical protein
MTSKIVSIVVALCGVLIGAPALSAPPPVRSYVWYGELAGMNEDASTALLKAGFREHVLRYIDQFKPGDRVILTWAPKGESETDAIIYVGKYSENTGRNFGYVLPVELVAIDKTDRRITFRVPVPAKATRTLKGMQIGSPLKITAPFDQPTDTATILEVEPAETQSKSTSSSQSGSSQSGAERN